EHIAATHEHLDQPMTTTTEICTHVFATATEISHGLLLRCWRRHHGEHTGPIELRELARIATVRLDSLARFAWDQRGCDDLAYDAAAFETPLQRIPARARFVTDADLAAL